MQPQLPSSNAIGSAVHWIEGVLLGPLATTVALIAVACIGLLMLAGRIDVRRGAQVVLGCFILFGASTIATGLHSAASGVAGESIAVAGGDPPIAPPPATPIYPEAATIARDPYAGAAVAPRQ